MRLPKTIEFAQRITRLRADGYRDALRSMDKVATSTTLNSVRFNFEATDFVIHGTVLASGGIPFIITGRRAGAKMPPQGVLIPWIRARNLVATWQGRLPRDTQKAERSIEFVIRRSIARKGIAPVDLNTQALQFGIPEPSARLRLRALIAEDTQDIMQAQAALIFGRSTIAIGGNA